MNNNNYPTTNQNPNYNNNMQFNNSQNQRKSVAVNQIQTNVVVIQDSSNFKTIPIVATCPNCRSNAITQVELIFSWSNYACYFYCTPLIWILYQSCRNKDISCNNSKHYCGSCGAMLATYHAC